ncbi:MAG: 50S ribosomal protein L35 [bacterium]|nr:50S ribosomal protein L35 [bacterium]
MKLKTIKAVAKRFKITPTNKLRHRKAGQDHFNAGETGKTTRSKRKDSDLLPKYERGIKKMMPYK